ncbi:Uracil phosphoribosyltransferase (fragment) [Capnocytophaga canimorsus]|uniref:Uracil phosphoribosyltransferase n=1 Tax=Capnocytophaga canimorsus TaxID=28188 RepID=A0A0B7H8A7_9FLAO
MIEQSEQHKKTLLSPLEINVILNRLACELIENHGDFSNTAFCRDTTKRCFFGKTFSRTT